MRCLQNGKAARCGAALIAAGALVHGLTGAEAAAPQAMPFDTPVTIGSIETVCTGIGVDARADARWSGYALKIEIAGKSGQYLGAAHIAVTKDGSPVVEADCGGPWVLFNLPAGRYRVGATIDDTSVSSAAYVPGTGQGRIVLRFPEVGGAVASPDTEALY